MSLAAGLANCASEGGDDGSTGTTADTTAPSVSSTSPASEAELNSVNLPATAQAEFTFDETLDSTVTPTIEVWAGDHGTGGSLPVFEKANADVVLETGTITVDGTDKTHTIVTYSDKKVTVNFPWAVWSENTHFVISINGVKDSSGNTMTTAHKLSFGTLTEGYTETNITAEVTPSSAASLPALTNRIAQDSNGTDGKYFTACAYGIAYQSGTSKCGTGAAPTYTFANAMNQCATLNNDSFAGRTNWHLMNKSELEAAFNSTANAGGHHLDSGFKVATERIVHLAAMQSSQSQAFDSNSGTQAGNGNVSQSAPIFCVSNP